MALLLWMLHYASIYFNFPVQQAAFLNVLTKLINLLKIEKLKYEILFDQKVYLSYILFEILFSNHANALKVPESTKANCKKTKV